MQVSNEPLYIGITMGDPAGIGPEIIVKAHMDEYLYETCRLIVIGDATIITQVINTLNLKNRVSLNVISEPAHSISLYGTINLINLSSLNKYTPGSPTIDGGKAMVSYIRYAVDMAIEKKLDAIVTCPINKYLMHKAGFEYNGHTPFISYLTKTKDYVMMLAGENLKVSLVTIHCALRDVPDMITKELVYKTIYITAKALMIDFDIKSPKIAVAALNPHAGEDGLFGDEEQIILEAINKAKEKIKVDIYGPFPPDTIFYKASNGEFDVVISMYHDQGLIPLKLLHFSDAVNITLGLPIIRTSVDHGTAYDIAGTGKADPSSLKSAIKMAVKLSKNRKKNFNIYANRFH